MAIDDDPLLVQLRDLRRDEADDPRRLFQPVHRCLTAISAAITWNPQDVFATLSGERQRRLNDLIDAVVARLVGLSAECVQRCADSAAYREYLEAEFPLLVFDAMGKVLNVRAAKRIERIASILTHGVAYWPDPGPDATEEMVRVAMDLDDMDVAVLKAIHDAQITQMGVDGRVPRMSAINGWPSSCFQQAGIVTSDVDSICAKLSSFGLIRPTENRALNNLADEPIPHGLLRKGERFVRYVRIATTSLNG